MTSVTIKIILFSAAAVLGFLLTVLARSIAWRLGITNAPNPIVAQHRETIAYLGGVSIAVALWIVLAVYGVVIDADIFSSDGPVMLLMLPAFGFLLTGLIDDLRPFSPGAKLLCQILLSLLAAGSGIAASLTGMAFVDLVISAFWIVLLVNAFNVTDVCDGLVTGLAIISLLFVAALAPSLQIVSIALAGACLGFMLLNAPPASIFLGDAGSHLLGFLLAGATLLALANPQPGLETYVAPLLVGVPLFELVFISVMRMRKGIPFWKGSPDHFALRLQARGLGRWQTDTVAWLAAIMMGVIAMLLPTLEIAGRVALITLTLLGCFASGRLLIGWDVKEKQQCAKDLIHESEQA